MKVKKKNWHDFIVLPFAFFHAILLVLFLMSVIFSLFYVFQELSKEGRGRIIEVKPRRGGVYLILDNGHEFPLGPGSRREICVGQIFEKPKNTLKYLVDGNNIVTPDEFLENIFPFSYEGYTKITLIMILSILLVFGMIFYKLYKKTTWEFVYSTLKIELAKTGDHPRYDIVPVEYTNAQKKLCILIPLFLLIYYAFLYYTFIVRM